MCDTLHSNTTPNSCFLCVPGKAAVPLWASVFSPEETINSNWIAYHSFIKHQFEPLPVPCEIQRHKRGILDLREARVGDPGFKSYLSHQWGQGLCLSFPIWKPGRWAHLLHGVAVRLNVLIHKMCLARSRHSPYCIVHLSLRYNNKWI